MNYNLIGYLLFFLIMGTIIVKVGWGCYRNGTTYVLHIIPNQQDFSLRINKMLLLGYYLVNIGYVVYSISTWEPIDGLMPMLENISYRTACIVLVLSGLHYMNIIALNILLKQNSYSS
ncbi:hypothetical protein ACFQZJ_04095 [Maribacter chungangensis]|uniref:DUF3784 domain-containing protein n=1 Tax=Maribacter chungangensis TaxID=1069117 RepID=A0ABW3B0A9_9FLAO